MRLCLALMNSKGLDSVLCPHHATAFNASFFVDMNGSKVRPIRTSSAGASTQASCGGVARCGACCVVM